MNTDAKIILDKTKMETLWNLMLSIWFKEGVDDKNIALIKASTKSANYWDSEGGKMINFLK